MSSLTAALTAATAPAMAASPCPVVELRQYTLRPGHRDTLIDLFDRQLVEPQEAAGMRVLGQFRDLSHPDRFVWLRGFPDMAARAEALGAFYGGPVWRAHRDAANATMLDSDDVLLLRPIGVGGLPDPAAVRAEPGAAAPRPSLVVATLCWLRQPATEHAVELVEREVLPVVAASGAPALAAFRTEHAANTFPRLPVRTGVEVVAWVARFASLGQYRAHRRRLSRSRRWTEAVLPRLLPHLVGQPELLLLQPTARSLLW